MINKYKTFKNPEEITKFLNERDNTFEVYIEVVNITCDNHGLWHLFYKEKDGLSEWLDSQDD